MNLQIINDPFTGEPYLKRFVVLRTKWLSIYFHKFDAPDADRHLHNHPWAWSFSLLLSGSYVERRWPRHFNLHGREYVGTEERTVSRFNWITSKVYHRIARLNGGVWTLFVGGPRTQDWGFWVDGKHVPHQEYFEWAKGRAA
jgi:hypothetical protein